MASPEQVISYSRLKGSVDSLSPNRPGRIARRGAAIPKASPNGRRPGSVPVPEAGILATPEVIEPVLSELEKLQSSGLPDKLMRENPEEGVGSVDDNTRIYLREIGRTPLLTWPEEVKLAQSIEKSRAASTRLKNPDLSAKDQAQAREEVAAGDQAREKLTVSNLRLVVCMAKKYHPQHLSFLDLVQEGNMGLFKAVEKFDWKRGFRFSTYASWWIRQAITLAIAEKDRLIRMPSHVCLKLSKLARAYKSIAEEGREPTEEEIAAEAGLPVKTVNQIFRATQDHASLETPVGEEGGHRIGDFVADSGVDPAEEAVSRVFEGQMREQIGTVLLTLTERERAVIGFRFGLGDVTPRTLGEMGAEFGLTRERIRQIEEEALKKLRHPSRSSKLRGFLF